MRPGTSGWRADTAVSENSHRLRVPEPSIDETVAILAVHGALEHDYGVQIADNALPAAATMAKRYVVGMPLPASALAVLHRACALLKLAGQSQCAFRPDIHARFRAGRRRRGGGGQRDDRHPGEQAGRGRARALRPHGRGACTSASSARKKRCWRSAGR